MFFKLIFVVSLSDLYIYIHCKIFITPKHMKYICITLLVLYGQRQLAANI